MTNPPSTADTVKKLIVEKRQFLLYIAIGGCGSLITYACYALLVQVFHVHYQIANAVGYGLGTLFSFAMNARYNFQTKDKLLLRLVSFLIVALIGGAVAAGILALLVGHFKMHPLIGYVIALMAVPLIQYNLNRLISFRKTA